MNFYTYLAATLSLQSGCQQYQNHSIDKLLCFQKKNNSQHHMVVCAEFLYLSSSNSITTKHVPVGYESLYRQVWGCCASKRGTTVSTGSFHKKLQSKITSMGSHQANAVGFLYLSSSNTVTTKQVPVVSESPYRQVCASQRSTTASNTA